MARLVAVVSALNALVHINTGKAINVQIVTRVACAHVVTIEIGARVLARLALQTRTTLIHIKAGISILAQSPARRARATVPTVSVYTNVRALMLTLATFININTRTLRTRIVPRVAGASESTDSIVAKVITVVGANITLIDVVATTNPGEFVAIMACALIAVLSVLTHMITLV